MIFPSTSETPSIAGSSVAWAFTRSTRCRLTSEYLQESKQELDLLFKELLIITSFFRDPRRPGNRCAIGAIHRLLSDHSTGHILRAWVPGCSTGAKSSSLAIVFKEAIEQSKRKENFKLQIFATDLDKDGVGGGPTGHFSAQYRSRRVRSRLRRFFAEEEGSVSRPKGDPRDGDFCAAKSHHGPAVYQAGNP